MTITGIHHRRFHGWLGLILLALALGCALPGNAISSENDASATGGQAPTQRIYTVGFAQDTLANDWRAAQVREVEQALASYPFIRFVYTDAQNQTAKQIMDIEDLLNQGVDVLITSPRDGKALTPVIARAYRQGTPVVLLSRRIESEDFTVFIGHNDREIGRRAARLLAERLDGKGSIVVLQGIATASTTQERTTGFIEELGQHKGLSIAAMKPANYLRNDAVLAMEEIIEARLHFDAIFAQSDSMAAGARLALKANGISPEHIPIIGIDYIAEARQAIRAGEQAASFIYATGGREGAQQVLRILGGEPVPKYLMLESELVTTENVERIAPIF